MSNIAETEPKPKRDPLSEFYERERQLAAVRAVDANQSGPNSTRAVASREPVAPPPVAARGEPGESRMVFSVSRDQIVESPKAQPREQRHVTDDLEDLVASILSRGMLDPIKVVQVPGDEKFHVVDGHRRLAALDIIAVTNPVVLERINIMLMGQADPLERSRELDEAVAKLDPEGRALLDAIVLNSQRRGLSAAEQGKGYMAIREKLGRTELVATAVGVTRQYAYRAIRAAEAVTEVQESSTKESVSSDEQPLLSPRRIAMMRAIVSDAKALGDDHKTALVKWLRACATAIDQRAGRVPLP